MMTENEANASQTPDMQVHNAGELHVSAPLSVNLITKDELNRKMRAGEAIQIVNVMSPDKYTLGMIKGSKRIPLDKMDLRLNELNKSKLIVTYCAGSDCNASKLAAEKLMAKGFSVSAYEGGIKEWREAGLPTEG